MRCAYSNVVFASFLLKGAIVVADAFWMPPPGFVPSQRRTTRTTINMNMHMDTQNCEKDNTTLGSKGQKPSKTGPSIQKYDLGLGKNAPLLPSPKREEEARIGSEGRSQENSSHDTKYKMSKEHTTTYNATRFLVEHEATREYPVPRDNYVAMDALVPSLSDHPSPSTTGSTKASAATKAADKRMIVVSNMPTSAKSQRRHPMRVQPRRSLEDCLTILDHEFSHAMVTAQAAAVPTNSTITSLPDSPQLDMNSVWVEMLLHNQMALEQTRS